MGAQRIALVVWRLSAHGGIPVLVRSLAKELAKRGKDVHLVSLRPRFAEDQLEDLEPDVTFHFLGIDTPADRRAQLAMLYRLPRLLRSIDPDVIHTHSGIAWYAAFVRGRARRVLEIHDSPQIGRTSRINHRVTSWMANHGWRVVAHSERVSNDIASAYGVADDSIQTFALGIDDRFSEAVHPQRLADVRSELGIDEDAVVVSWVGRMTAAKAPGAAIEIADRVENPKVVFVIAGSGPLVEDIRESAPSNVVVAGPVDDLVALYQTSRLFLSTSEYEGFGLAIVEAQMAGLPVLALEGGAVRERFLDPDGVVFERDELDEIAAAIDQLVSVSDLSGAAVAQTTWVRINLSVAAMVDSFVAVYQVPSNGPSDS